MLISKLKSKSYSFFRVANEELSQATARLVFTIVILIGFYVSYGFNNEEEIIYSTRMYIMLFLFYAILHWLHISIYNKEYLLRKLIAIIADISGVSIMLYLTGAEGSLLFPIYFWIVLGNGIRFGSKYLFFSMILALVGFQLVLSTNPFWLQFPYLGAGLSFAIVILPMFYFIIMHRLHNRNYLLMEQLKSSVYEKLHDPLTSLPNRAFLLVQMQDFAKRGHPYFLFFIDLDGFKKVNDIHGHHAGDKVLEEVASRIESTLQHFEGFAARLGGDEFAVITELKNKNDMIKLATQLVNEISKPYNGYHPRISSSIGITHFEPNKPREIEDLLKEADRAMYQVKAEGKNGFRCYQDV